MKAKQVAYSYPSSPNAEKFGFGKTGCYTVSLVALSPVRKPPVSVIGLASLESAKAYANTMPEPWDKYSL